MKHFKTGFNFTIGAFAASAVVGLITFAAMCIGLWFKKIFGSEKDEFDDLYKEFQHNEVEE